MDAILLHVFPIGATLSYLLAALGYVSQLRFRSGFLARNARFFGILGCVQHALFILGIGVCAEGAGTRVLFDLPGTLSIISVLLYSLFLFGETRFRVGGLGVIVAPLVLVLMVWSSVVFHLSSFGTERALDGERNTFVITLHWGAIVFGLSLLALGFAASTGVLIHDNLLKRRRFTVLQQKLPPLLFLDRLQFQLVFAGVFFLTCGVGVGLAVRNGLTEPGGGFAFLRDPTVSSSLLTLVVYSGTLVAQLLKGWRGRQAAWLSVCGFATIVVSFLSITVFGTTFHGF